MGKAANLCNQKFGKLLVISRLDMKSSNGGILWSCLCDCGNLTKATTGHLRWGNRASCGCLLGTRSKKHGMYKEPEYFTWNGMIQRCTNEKSLAYSHYGARGIKVCSKWLESFENFYEDMGERPEGMTLDRIDVDGDYCKENCRWSDKSTQGFNKRIAPNNTSGRTGVYWHKMAEKWMASISVNGKSIHLGLHNSFEDAVKAREDAELEYYGVIKE